MLMSMIFLLYACSDSSPTGPEPYNGIVPLPVYPENASILSRLTIKLTVRNAAGYNTTGCKYLFQISSDIYFNTIVFQKEVPGGTDTTSVSVTENLTGGSSYYWRAKASCGSQSSGYSTTFMFTLESYRGAPQPIAPLEEAIEFSGSLHLRVHTSPYFPSGNDIYRFEIFKISRGNPYSHTNVSQDTLSKGSSATPGIYPVIIKEISSQPETTQVAIEDYLSEGAYGWRVRAYRNIGGGAQLTTLYSNMIHFYVADNCNKYHNGKWATELIENRVACGQYNLYQDAFNALGSPDAKHIGPRSYTGFVSLGIDGWIVVGMGECIKDGPGYDLAVYQTSASEGVGIEVAPTIEGPWHFLNWVPCNIPSQYFSNVCFFDLGSAGVAWARYVRIIDYERGSMPQYAFCELDYLHPGADIDAAEVLNPY